jgi:hypothetical protein
MAALYGLDIETDTAIDGRDPRVAGVIAIAIADANGAIAVLCGPERAALRGMVAVLDDLPPGVVTTWNGSGFDLPFIAERCAKLGIALPWELTATDLPAKYAPLPNRAGRYRATLGAHAHADIAWAYEEYCNETATPWSLKPLAHALGIPAIEADREHAGDLPTDELVAYVVSDALVTAKLAHRLGATLTQYVD